MKLTPLKILNIIDAKVTRLHRQKVKEIADRTGYKGDIDALLVLHFVHGMSFDAIEETLTEDVSIYLSEQGDRLYSRMSGKNHLYVKE
jgi:hypothetical protein